MSGPEAQSVQVNDVLCGTRADCHLPLHWGDQLDAVAEGVAGFEAFVSGDGDGFEGEAAGLLEPGTPVGEVVDAVGDVRLARRAIDASLDADVQLLPTDFQPEAAALPERFRLLDLSQAKHAAIEGARNLLLPNRDCDLNVIYGKGSLVFRLWSLVFGCPFSVLLVPLTPNS